MTRVSVTNDGATVVVVEVLVDVGVEVVVDGDVEVVVVAGVVAADVDEVAAADVTITVEACGPGATDEDASDPDEHDNITCDATSNAHDHVRFVIVVG